MKICIAQTEPFTGDIVANINAHQTFIELALSLNAEAIFFSELSLTGYEPALAKKLATDQDDTRLDIFQQISDINSIIIGVGLPTISGTQIRISMVIFEPNKKRRTYSKQILHSDEFPYFHCGVEQVLIKTTEINIAPAICYESLQQAHADDAIKLSADLYLASVAKSAAGIEKALDHFPRIAKQHSIPVIMCNAIGVCDNFISVGKSAVWNKEGKLLGQLDDNLEGVLIFDTVTEVIVKKHLNTFNSINKC